MRQVSEVSLAASAKAKLEEDQVSVRIVAMPSWELFDRQSKEYKESVLPSSVTKRVSLEMGVSLGWERYVGQEGKVLSIETFGASGTGAEVMESIWIYDRKCCSNYKKCVEFLSYDCEYLSVRTNISVLKGIPDCSDMDF
ncbi:transketolase-like TK C-terminal-containing protein [Bacillus pacificus]